MDIDVKSLVEQQIQALIVQAFRDAPEAIDELVRASMAQEVDEYGGKPDYHTRQKMPYLEWLVGNTIRNVARAAVVEVVQAREAEIKGAVQRAVTADSLVEGLVQSILGSLQKDYRVQVNFADENDA